MFFFHKSHLSEVHEVDEETASEDGHLEGENGDGLPGSFGFA